MCLNPNRRRLITKAVLPLAALAALGLAWAAFGAEAGAADVAPVFKPLAKHLAKQGMPTARARRLLASPKLRFEARLLARLLARPEKTLNYQQFLSPSTVRRARRWQHRHRSLLKEGRIAYGVPGSVVVAILAVESGLGSYTGNHLTMNVLASQAVLDNKAAQKLLYRRWPAKQRKYFHSKKFKQRLQWRAMWARGEVLALIKLAAKERRSPYGFQGSVAGAVGMCQFVPSSVLEHAVDGDRDGKIDLHTQADAVKSVGAYLRNHGWRPGLDRAGQVRVILTYNRSRPYANTVLALAGKLR